MGAKAEVLGNPVAPGGEWLFPENHTGEPLAGAGMVVVDGRYLAVKSSNYRPRQELPGDAVEGGQPLLVIEAMKMQNEVRAPRAGTVGRVAAAEGRPVELGDLLLVLE
jgi:hypothetical protein